MFSSYKPAMRTIRTPRSCTALFPVILGCFFMVYASPPSFAKEELADMLVGVPYVQGSGSLAIHGREVSLWGTERLAPDQQCWQAETAWPCGEYAAMALKHLVQGRMVECVVKEKAVDQLPAQAVCSLQKGQEKKDIAEQLIFQGWAMARKNIGENPYQKAEDDAHENRRGVWSSKFQSAEDWREGIQRFIGEDDTAPSDTPESALPSPPPFLFGQ